VGGWRYFVERTEVLGAFWTTVDERVGAGTVVEIETDAGVGSGFFRVRVD
jgi:hypothetical protein